MSFQNPYQNIQLIISFQNQIHFIQFKIPFQFTFQTVYISNRITSFKSLKLKLLHLIIKILKFLTFQSSFIHLNLSKQ